MQDTYVLMCRHYLFYHVCFCKLGSCVILSVSLRLLPRQESSIWNKDKLLTETDTWQAIPRHCEQIHLTEENWKAVWLTLYFRDPFLRLLLHHLLLELDLCYLGNFLSLCGTENITSCQRNMTSGGQPRLACLTQMQALLAGLQSNSMIFTNNGFFPFSLGFLFDHLLGLRCY